MSVSPTASAYDVAVDFIRLANIVRLWQNVGWEPSSSMLQEMVDCRYHLDSLLYKANNWSQWTDEAWASLVQSRLTTADSRPTVAG